MDSDAVKTLARTTTNSIGQPIEYPRDGTPEVTALLVEMAPGEETGWHSASRSAARLHPRGRTDGLSGHGRETRGRAPGEVSLESVDVVHNGVNEGAVPLQDDRLCRRAEGRAVYGDEGFGRRRLIPPMPGLVRPR